MTDIQLIQFPHQLSPAVYDKSFGFGIWWMQCLTDIERKTSGQFHAIVTCEFRDTADPQDIGIETFAGDTLEGGLPDD